MYKFDTPFDKDMIYIKTPDNIHNTYGLCLWLTYRDEYIVNKFQTHVIRILTSFKETIGIDFMYFIQGKDSNWCYIELWNGNKFQTELLNIAQVVSIDLNLPLDIV